MSKWGNQILGGEGLRVSPAETSGSLLKKPWERPEELLARRDKRTVDLSSEFKSDGAIDRSVDHSEDS